ncbi:carbohydrate ABC transporter permease [Nocardioides sp. Kera G14]|uniref:carbohydrate ABC transporter permease n=1 Tax=Nocardioides sp. Kera G14 TaxID=2884264 RepID=UPI001D125B9D|nr:sugar ABC transporter permease [Nocardioides sp. Kera G14]UDY24949.1 sugar ABC transporter permease [Nocardioides sp. Kera G14]
MSATQGGARTLPRRRGLGWGQRAEIALLSGPAILVFLTFVILPVIMAVYYGFYRWQGYGPPTDFVWFQNYKVILTDPDFRSAVWHNAEIVILSLLIQGPIAILLALLLNRKIRGRSLIRVLVFVPWVVSEVIAGTGWSLMLPVQGAINHLLTGLHVFGHVHIDWMGNTHLAIWTLMGILTWKYIGFAVILLMAGLQNIPEELYEAASIDGATYWQQQRRITLPLLGPTIRIWMFLSIIGALQLFDLVYIIWGQYNTSVAGVSTMATYMYQNGKLAGNYGYGNAVAVTLFVISLIVAVAYQRLILRRDMSDGTTEGRKAR